MIVVVENRFGLVVMLLYVYIGCHGFSFLASE